YRSNFDYPIQLVWINSEGTMTGKVGEPIPDLTRAESSPDERRIVVETGTWNTQARLWLLDPMRPGLMPLTLETDRAAHAFWLSDNQRVLFTRRVEPDKESRVWVKSVDDLSGGKELFKGWANHLSRDGNHLVLRTAQTNASGTTIQFVTLDGTEQPVTLPPELKEAGSFRLSPDGRLLGYYQHENDEG